MGYLSINEVSHQPSPIACVHAWQITVVEVPGGPVAARLVERHPDMANPLDWPYKIHHREFIRPIA